MTDTSKSILDRAFGAPLMDQEMGPSKHQEKVASERLNLFEYICSEPEFLDLGMDHIAPTDRVGKASYDEDGYDFSSIDQDEELSDEEKSHFKAQAKENLDEFQREAEAYRQLPICIYPSMQPRVVQFGVHTQAGHREDNKQLPDLSKMGDDGLVEMLKYRSLLSENVKLASSSVIIVGYYLDAKVWEDRYYPFFLMGDVSHSEGRHRTHTRTGPGSQDNYMLHQAIHYAHEIVAREGVLRFILSRYQRVRKPSMAEKLLKRLKQLKEPSSASPSQRRVIPTTYPEAKPAFPYFKLCQLEGSDSSLRLPE